MRLFTELRILVQTFISSMRALAWSMVFLFLLMVISAVFLSYSLQDFIIEDCFRTKAEGFKQVLDLHTRLILHCRAHQKRTGLDRLTYLETDGKQTIAEETRHTNLQNDRPHRPNAAS